jgi:hypothetical protein
MTVLLGKRAPCQWISSFALGKSETSLELQVAHESFALSPGGWLLDSSAMELQEKLNRKQYDKNQNQESLLLTTLALIHPLKHDDANSISVHKIELSFSSSNDSWCYSLEFGSAKIGLTWE